MGFFFFGGGGGGVEEGMWILIGICRCKFCSLPIQLLNPFALRTAKNP